MSEVTTDVVIVGSGVSGALLAYKLSAQGIKTLILEAGAKVERNDALNRFYNAPLKTPESPYLESTHAPFPKTVNDTYFTQAGSAPFKSTFLRVVGGTTWHWLGTCMRLLPDDFQMKSKFGVGVDWPIFYDDLENWYLMAEQELGVAGHNKEDLDSPRKQNYPLVEIPPSKLDEFVKQKLQNSPYQVCHTPQARNSTPYDNRSACCLSASCVPICPIQAKYDATVHLNKSILQGTQLLDNSVVYRIECDEETGDVIRIFFKKPDGSIHSVKSKVYVLAANAIENAKILLMSKTSKYKNGIANISDQIGRNLMDHPIILGYALTPEDVFPYNDPLCTSGIENFRNGDFRAQYAAYRLEIHNDGWNFPTGGVNPLIKNLIDQGYSGKELASLYKNTVAKQISFAALTEQLPDPANRVELDLNRSDILGLSHPKITYSINSYLEKSFQDSKNKMTEILKILNCNEINMAESFFGAGHILGTHRMGRDRITSVVNENMQCHDHKNLLLIGGGVMPTCGTSNPTLTIAALSLRCADFIIKSKLLHETQ